MLASQVVAMENFLSTQVQEGTSCMKLTNLSLAILVAVGVAACGGSDDNNSNRPVDPKTPSTPDNNNNNNNNNNQANDQQHVDPTNTKVVDNKDLTQVSTVGTLQYIRREGSQYDRANNQSKQASASPLLGVTLNDQNPSLTNIVLARQELVRADGQPVKAQFAGSDDPKPLDANTGAFQRGSKNSISLQEENFQNVDVLAGMYQVRDAGNQTTNNVDTSGAISRTLVDGQGVYHAIVTKDTNVGTGVNGITSSTKANKFERVFVQLAGSSGTPPTPSAGTAINPDDPTDPAAPEEAYNTSPRIWDTKTITVPPVPPATTPTITTLGANGEGRYSTDGVEGFTAIIDAATWKKSSAKQTRTKTTPGTPPTVTPVYDLESNALTKDGKGQDIYYYRGETKALNDAKTQLETTKKTVTTKFANDNGTRYGKGLVWWSTPETAFENEFTRRGTNSIADTQIDPLNKALGTSDGTTTTVTGSQAATNGLVRIGGGLSTLGEETKYNSSTGKWEDHHNTTTRIFGRYHLAYAEDNTVNPVSLNSYSGVRTFVAEYDADNQNRATQYSIGARPMTLTRVQYGRVSNNLDLDAGQTGYADNFMRSDFVRKNDDGGVDNYFYRGIDATSIEQMAALPSNQLAVYNGHALMYGIDNNYHGATDSAGRDLPNAFAPEGASGTSRIGLGNFVEARANFNNKRVTGEVYNTWLLDPSKNTTTKDVLVRFQGSITGNTVVGSADRDYGVYKTSDDDATFKASFFGDKAQEMGGSFNSVKDTDRYGDAYGTNDWGGVFGATRGETNTFQGDDGNKVYTNNKYAD